VLQPTELFSPAVEGLHGDLGFLAGLRGGLSVGDPYFNLPQQRHALLRLVPSYRHVQLPSSEILSHSSWTISGRARQHD
jgi:hypothetical protein